MERSGLIGQTLNGRYKIEELLGQGGMSAVYKAFDPNLKRMVAVKVIHSHLAGDARFRSRFESEATAVAALRHSNIVQVYDFSNDDDLYYMVQEFVPGETLQDHLRRLNEGGRSMPVADALRYTGDIAEAAGYAHRRGMIHRDIKPANIMLSVHDEAILMDFGIVKITGSSEHTVTGAVVGTALYMPPELIRGEVPDPRSDIYSLGVTLYEMVSGRPPFDANSAMTLLMMHLQDPVPELREVRPDVPDPLMDIVRRALAKDREERFASMEDLGRALRNLRDHLETGVPLLHALPTEIEARADQPPGDEETLPDTAPRPRPQEAPAIPLRARRTPPARRATFPAATPPAGQAPVQGEVPATAGGLATMGEAHPPAPPPAVPPPTAPPRRLAGRGLWAGGAVVLLALLLGLGYLVMNRPWDGGDADGALAAAEATATAEATAQDQPAALATGAVAGENGDPAEEAAAPSITIADVTLDEEGRYVVAYDTEGLPETMTDRHLHFFFDNVPPEEAGAPASGPWLRYYGPSPFTGYTAQDRPANAGRLCAQVNNPDHTPVAGTADCAPLPDVVTVSAEQALQCRVGPGDEHPVAAELPAGEPTLVLGLAPNELWWNVVTPGDLGATCWLPTVGTNVTGDISRLPLVEAPEEFDPAARPMAAIEGIGVDEKGRYSAVFTVINFEPAYPGGTHMHFFWNTFSPEDVGIGGEANRLSHGSLEPFAGFRADERPPTATDLCVVVANPNHTVIPDSGNCYPLPDVPRVRITGISLDEQGQYAVDFAVEHFEPAYPGTHIHFFWDTFSEEDVGIGGEANRRAHGGPSPFGGLAAAERPAEATRLCAVVAVPDHTVIPRSGNCFDLPDVAGEG
ncbi:MAG: serine/threonine protein kinase [Anaerolineaceae bacterium]|nr:serine/threonine protein kinase [Anaerolineaceae bacterium]